MILYCVGLENDLIFVCVDKHIVAQQESFEGNTARSGQLEPPRLGSKCGKWVEVE